MTTDGTVVSLGTDDMLALGSKTYELEPASAKSVFTMPDETSFTAVTTEGEVVALGTDGRLRVGGMTYSLGVGASESMGVGGGVFEGGAGRGRGMGIWVGVAVAVAVGGVFW